MKEKIFRVKNQEETEALAQSLAQMAAPGMVIAMRGDLGTGKTTFTKAFAKGLGIEETVTSPTFNIVKEYRGGRIPLYHFDVYRIDDPEEMYELGYEEYFYGDGVCAVEWAEKIGELIPEDAVRIHISYGEKEGERIYRCIF
ncbi:MAG TPA: tRNA (adenosine(37)-N6)-threonylcarbamoyltransferase complex ATPase subunit type 1 TsaE [Candidatus Copromorpha excrementigallinarum]|uniref:tRNA threonylcarbamoyladenosine biosynthesis protein TsaE n=1 Tax=Candidatus Allocopromorpha excrementigallinarum TaxID=2840742 RepID=A0A9D1I4D1_9FIRM|nr:tRNA (adenosine(37)-N6)-threonylcarbamoyltransferase complex ATPase subunit type 1 TsaE [Candidatus Copromorpha excrementigallinarum]